MRSLPRAGGVGTLINAVTAAAALVIAVATLRSHPPSEWERLHDWRCLVCGEYGGADVVANVLLFAPLGAGLAARTGSWTRSAAVALAFSTGIEVSQATWVSGRFPALGDVVANTSGAMLGAAFVTSAARWAHPSAAAARWLAAGATLVWLGVLAFSAWAFERQPGAPIATPTRGLVRAVPGSGWYTGHVRDAQLAGTPLGAGPTTGPLIVGATVGRQFAMASTLDRCDATGRPVAFLFVHDAAGESQAVLGQHRSAARFSTRLRARALRLRRPTVVLPGAFPPEADVATVSITPQSPCVATTRVRGEFRDHTLIVAAAGSPDGKWRERRLVLTPTLGWSLLVPFVRPGEPLGDVVTALWLAGLLVPFGYWATFAAPGRAGWGARVGIVISGCAAGLLALPAAAGYQTGSWWEWGAALGGAGAGAALAARVGRTRPTVRAHRPPESPSATPTRPPRTPPSPATPATSRPLS